MFRVHFETLHAAPNDCHAARTHLRGSMQSTPHDHDFLELFLVTAGAGTHHVNGEAVPLLPGDVCLVRAADAHHYSVGAGGTLEFVNVAFAADWWAGFRRLLPGALDLSGLLEAPLPPRARVPEAGRGEARARFEALLGGGSALRQVEVVVLALGSLLPRVPTAAPGERRPAWLDRVAARLREPEFLAGGVAGIYQAAGCSPEHAARTCRRFLGTTPTDLLNRARIERVKTRLLAGDEKIAALAFDAGFENLGYFYRVFRRFAGSSPQQWRREHGAARVVPP